MNVSGCLFIIQTCGKSVMSSWGVLSSAGSVRRCNFGVPSAFRSSHNFVETKHPLTTFRYSARYNRNSQSNIYNKKIFLFWEREIKANINIKPVFGHASNPSITCVLLARNLRTILK